MNIDTNDLSPILESIAKANGKGYRNESASQLAIARMTAKLRCVSKDMAQIPISIGESVGREILAKLPWEIFWVSNFHLAGIEFFHDKSDFKRQATLRALCTSLYLNRPQQTAFKNKIVADFDRNKILSFSVVGPLPYSYRDKPYQMRLNLIQLFQVATWYLENHGGLAALYVRRERHKQLNAKTMYVKMRNALQHQIEHRSREMKRHSDELEKLQSEVAKHESLLADASKSKQDAEIELARRETEEKERQKCNKKRRMN